MENNSVEQCAQNAAVVKVRIIYGFLHQLSKIGGIDAAAVAGELAKVRCDADGQTVVPKAERKACWDHFWDVLMNIEEAFDQRAHEDGYAE